MLRAIGLVKTDCEIKIDNKPNNQQNGVALIKLTI
jgi:hypothetical protein